MSCPQRHLLLIVRHVVPRLAITFNGKCTDIPLIMQSCQKPALDQYPDGTILESHDLYFEVTVIVQCILWGITTVESMNQHLEVREEMSTAKAKQDY